MPQVLDSRNGISIRIMYAKGQFKLQYRLQNEIGEDVWVNAAVVNERGEILGHAVEVVIESLDLRSE